MNIILNLLINTIAVILLAYLLPGVTLGGNTIVSALIVAIVLALLNLFVRPILIIFTLPITIFTLGLFLLIINALIIMLADYLIDGFAVSSIWIALLFSILLSVLQSILHSIFKEPKN